MTLRQATAAETHFYLRTLYPLQDRVFEVARDGRFYLTGDTCLSRFHFHHRYSEDLDFFFAAGDAPLEEFDGAARAFAHALSGRFALEPGIDGAHFKRYTVKTPEAALKVELVFDPHPAAGESRPAGNVLLDSLEDIVANKVTAAKDRKTSKDFYDLLHLLRRFDLADAERWAALKAMPIDYENLLVMFADGRLEGEVLTAGPPDLEAFAAFAQDLKRRLIEHARAR